MNAQWETWHHLVFLNGAYMAIWGIICFYLAVLIRRNRRLTRLVAELEERVADWEMAKGEERG